MHPDVQKYIDLFREATVCPICGSHWNQEINGFICLCSSDIEQVKTDPFTVTDEELDEIHETGDIPYFLNIKHYEVVR